MPSFASLPALAAGRYFLLDIQRARLDYPALKRAVITQRAAWRADHVVIEHASNGLALVQQLCQDGPFKVREAFIAARPCESADKRVSRIAIIQEHKMILNAIKMGVSEERLARALNVDIANIRVKRNLLVGICPEVADMLRDRHIPIHVFTELRRLKPIRQIEAAQAMITINRFSVSYAKSLVASTPEEQLVEGRKHKPRGLTAEQSAVMQRESENLDREFKTIENSFSEDHLDLVLAIGYVNRLLGNVRVVRHLAQHHAALFAQFQKIVDFEQAA
jgi:hypothetical protein